MGVGGGGGWSEKVQDVGEGSGFEHHENPAGAAGGRETVGPGPDTHSGGRESPATGGP